MENSAMNMEMTRGGEEVIKAPNPGRKGREYCDGIRSMGFRLDLNPSVST